MTEAEWRTSRSLYDMLISFPEPWSKRKFWLFSCACLRRQWHLLRDERTRRCVEVAERFIDGAASAEEVNETWEAFDAAAHSDGLADHRYFDSYEAIRNLICFVDPAASLQTAGEVAAGAGGFAAEALHRDLRDGWGVENTRTWEEMEQKERREQTELLRDLFGNPFRLVSVDPSWLTSDVLALAEGIYQERDFSPMPVLADALQDAGCDSEDILNHCRQPGKHVRGCWVVDLLTGRK